MLFTRNRTTSKNLQRPCGPFGWHVALIGSKSNDTDPDTMRYSALVPTSSGCCRIYSASDVRLSKLLSGSASCDLVISILQKKAISELYPVVPVSSCAFNVCGSYAHFNFFPYKLPLNKNVNALRLYCTDS